MSMVVEGTPVTDETAQWGLWVKHEEACCPGGPNFSKTRGVYAHVAARPEGLIGVLDTAHSQGGWAVARACQQLGKRCIVFYPQRKHESHDIKPQQDAAVQLGANLVRLQAGRSAVLYHAAKKLLPEGAYMMPNALKLPEMVTETVAEVARTDLVLPTCTLLISASSGTIAAGVIRGLYEADLDHWHVIIHMGYSRSYNKVRAYIEKMSGTVVTSNRVTIVDEGYAYADEARAGPTPEWPCNRFYDLKAFRYWVREGRAKYETALFWNIG